MPSWKSVWALSLASAWCAVACLYDGDERCGPNQELSDVQSCVCSAGFVLAGNECTPCPENERELGGACVCDDGYQRAAEGDPCTSVPVTGLGSPCDTPEDCTEPDYPHCQAAMGESYCTTADCQSSADCPDGFACDLAASPSVCLRPPVGQGRACESSDDCADAEATYCETFFSNACLVEGCSLSPDDCFEGWECCDGTSVGIPKQLCVPEGQCPTK